MVDADILEVFFSGVSVELYFSVLVEAVISSDVKRAVHPCTHNFHGVAYAFCPRVMFFCGAFGVVFEDSSFRLGDMSA